MTTTFLRPAPAAFVAPTDQRRFTDVRLGGPGDGGQDGSSDQDMALMLAILQMAAGQRQNQMAMANAQADRDIERQRLEVEGGLARDQFELLKSQADDSRAIAAELRGANQRLALAQATSAENQNDLNKRLTESTLRSSQIERAIAALAGWTGRKTTAAQLADQEAKADAAKEIGRAHV